MDSAYEFIHSGCGDWSQIEKAAVAEKMAKKEWNQENS